MADSEPAGDRQRGWRRWLPGRGRRAAAPQEHKHEHERQHQQPVERSGVSASVVAAAEGRDVLSPLPSRNGRSSSAASAALLAGGAPSTKRPAFPSHTLGSLTAWQMLAADVQAEMEAAAAGVGSNRSSQYSERLSRCSSRSSYRSSVGHRGSGVEQGLAVSQGSELSDARQQRDSSTLQELQLLTPQQRADGAALAASGGSASGGSTAASDGSFTGAPSESRLEREYQVLGELGRGAFGRALKARRRCDGAVVCLKAMDTASMGATERRMTRGEVRVLRSLQHPNIVQYHDCWTEAGGTQYISMEFCEEGDLEGLLKGRGGSLLSEDDVMLRFVQLCLALQHVHSKGILHRDIKTNNVFLGRHGILKLGDFGISKVMAPGKSHAHTMVGTPYYFSPELVEDKPYNRKSDVWAAGCVLYELATLQRPFRGSSVSAIAVKILRGTPAPLPDQYSAELRGLVASLLQRRPERRPSMDEVLSMEYVRRHLQRFCDFVQSKVECRKQSYFQAAAQYLRQASARLSVAPAPQQAQQHEQAQEQPAAVSDGTVLIRGAGGGAGADLACALSSARSAAKEVAAAAAAAATPVQQRQHKAPKYTNFSAVQLLQAAAGVAGSSHLTPPVVSPPAAALAVKPPLGPESPQESACFPTLSSIGTAGTSGGALPAEGVLEAGLDAEEPAASSSGGMLRQQVPVLLAQVEQLLEASAAPGQSGAGRREEEFGERRRAAEHEACEEELLSVLPPPRF